MFDGSASTPTDAYAKVELWGCGGCKAEGYLNVRAYVVSRKTERGQTTTTTADRLVFSAALSTDDLGRLQHPGFSGY
jgi:hypothetical protein